MRHQSTLMILSIVIKRVTGRFAMRIVILNLLLLCASNVLSAEVERGVDRWNSILDDFRDFSSATNFLSSEKALAEKTLIDHLEKLVRGDWTNAPQNLNTIFDLMTRSTNCSSHLKYHIAERAMFSGGPPMAARDGQSRLQCLTNVLNVLGTAKDIYSGIDPQFDPDDAPGNKVTPPPELLRQYQIPSADKSYTNSPLWKTAVLQHQIKRQVYDDQIGRRRDYAELLQFIKLIGAMPSEYREIIRQTIQSSNLPTADQETLKASLAPEVK